jgi:hypothetical protein
MNYVRSGSIQVRPSKTAPMSSRPTILERAYALASSGEFQRITDIKARLKAEGYADVRTQLFGTTIHRDLRRLIERAERAKVGAASEDA